MTEQELAALEKVGNDALTLVKCMMLVPNYELEMLGGSFLEDANCLAKALGAGILVTCRDVLDEFQQDFSSAPTSTKEPLAPLIALSQILAGVVGEMRDIKKDDLPAMLAELKQKDEWAWQMAKTGLQIMDAVKRSLEDSKAAV